MLEKNDLEMIQKIMEKGFHETEKRLNQSLDNKLDALADSFDNKLDALEDSLLDEIGRTQTYLEKQIGEVKINVEKLEQYYRLDKLKNDNTAILLKTIENIDKRLTVVEMKMA